MAEALFPVVEVLEFTQRKKSYDTQYKKSVRWNPETGDFVRNGAGRMVECDGEEAFAVWCFKTAQTERSRCLAYPASIGTEMERAMQSNDEKTVESMVQRTVKEALMVNPRTEDVWDFIFSWNGDQMHCSFKVKGVHLDGEITITI